MGAAFALSKLGRMLALVTLVVTVLGGCTSSGKLSKTLDKALQVVGLETTANKKPSTLTVQLHAGSNLNAGNSRKPSATIIKIYRLRGTQLFEQAPLNAFLNESSEKSALGTDLISVREVVLSPNIQQDVSEELTEDTAALGVIALFRTPAENRWRLAFDARNPELLRKGVTVGLHACALTTANIGLLSRYSGEPNSLASIRC